MKQRKYHSFRKCNIYCNIGKAPTQKVRAKLKHTCLNLKYELYISFLSIADIESLDKYDFENKS